MRSRLNFVRQQGFQEATAQDCGVRFGALMWQPRVILLLAVLGLLFETGWYWVGLSLVLWWGALRPRHNLFDLAYNALVARRRGLPEVPSARGPRRLSMALAGALSMGVGIAMLQGRAQLAWHITGLLFLAIVLLVFGRFCLGSYIFHLVTGRAAYAHRTLPWSRSEP